MNDAYRKGILALIITNTIWGIASPVFKWSLEGIPPFTLAFLRFLIATVLIGLFLRGRVRPRLRTKKETGLLILYTFTSISFAIGFFFFGLMHTLAMNGPVITSAAPILTFIFAATVLHEKIRARKIAGMAIGTMGVVLIILEPLLLNGMDGSIMGNLFLVIAMVSNAIGMICGRELFENRDPKPLMFWVFALGAASFLPFAAYEASVTPDLWSHITSVKGLVGIAYGAIFSSTIAYTFQAYGLSVIKASEASLFTYVDPVAGTIISYFFLHEPITLPFVIGALFIFGGIFIAEGRLHYHPIPKLKRKRERPDSSQAAPDMVLYHSYESQRTSEVV